MEHWLWIILPALCFGLISGDSISPVGREVSEREGQSVTLTCNYETSNDVRLYWYKHHSDLQPPQFILWKWSDNTGEHIPNKRYGSETSPTSTMLTITKLTLADTALYYCALDWGGLLFGNPIELTVKPAGPQPPPTLFVLSPLHPEGRPVSELGDEVCLAVGSSPKDNNIDLNVKDNKITVATESTAASGTAYYTTAFSNQTIYSCELNGTSANNEHFDLCADLHPEKAKLNFYMLVMNAVRVVFTKTVAFNTLLTIRAVIF